MKHIAFLLTFLLSSNAWAFSDEITEGSYECKGVDKASGEEYNTYATINKRGDHYVMTWEYKGKKYDGVGIIHEEEDDIIAFNFSNEELKSKKKRADFTTGVRIYHFDDEMLEGKWMFSGTRVINPEKCVKKEKWIW